MDLGLYAKIRFSGRYCRDIESRKKINLFLEAVRLESVRKACRKHGVVPKTYYFWWNRFTRSGFNLKSLECLSRRPKSSPKRTKGIALKWIKHYRIEFHYGPERIQMYLRLNHKIHAARSTIQEIIRRENLILRKNKKPHVNHHTRRYSLPWPGDRLQMDIKYVPYKIGDEQYYVYNAIDDCSRWRISRLYRNKGIQESVNFLRYVHQMAPFKIRSIQLDNDNAFSYRLNPNCYDKRHPFESSAEDLGIRLKFIPPGEKELQGKVERLHRTDDDEFFWKAPRCSFNQLQRKLSQWEYEYNNMRHHKGLGWKTPKEILRQKYIEQRIETPYTDIRSPDVVPGVTICSFKQNYNRWLDRYLQYLSWRDSHPLPVTDVSGYYRYFRPSGCFRKRRW